MMGLNNLDLLGMFQPDWTLILLNIQYCVHSATVTHWNIKLREK